MEKEYRGLHVEDVETIHCIVKAFMGPEIELDIARSREEFFERLALHRYDFMILDGHIPGWLEADYLADIRQHCRVPFFVFSGCHLRELEGFAAAGARGIFEKINGPKPLRDAVLDLLKKSSLDAIS